MSRFFGRIKAVVGNSDSQNSVFISDLYLFSPKSVADPDPFWIARRYSDKERLLLGGGIFDFRWSRCGSTAATRSTSEQWLRRLFDRWSGSIAYLPGNHDSHPEFVRLPDRFQEQISELTWEFYFARFGDVICLHGDVCDAGSSDELTSYRARFHSHRPNSAIAHAAYDLAVAMRIHRMIPFLRHQFTDVCHFLADKVQRMAANSAGVRTVIFGHTHY